jgi:hypothetical protein
MEVFKNHTAASLTPSQKPLPRPQRLQGAKAETRIMVSNSEKPSTTLNDSNTSKFLAKLKSDTSTTSNPTSTWKLGSQPQPRRLMEMSGNKKPITLSLPSQEVSSLQPERQTETIQSATEKLGQSAMELDEQIFGPLPPDPGDKTPSASVQSNNLQIKETNTLEAESAASTVQGSTLGTATLSTGQPQMIGTHTVRPSLNVQPTVYVSEDEDDVENDVRRVSSSVASIPQSLGSFKGPELSGARPSIEQSALAPQISPVYKTSFPTPIKEAVVTLTLFILVALIVAVVGFVFKRTKSMDDEEVLVDYH